MGIRKQRGVERRGRRQGGEGGAGGDPADAPGGDAARHQLRLHPVHRGVGPRDPASSSSSPCCSPRWSAGCSSARSRARSTSMLAIPMSLLGTIAVIYFLGFTLNTFTLLGPGAGGRHRRRRRDHGDGEHLPPRRDGQGPGGRRPRRHREITFAALAATLAVVAIFIPVVFMDGVIGRFFLQFGVTLCVAVLLSYLEAITLAPARCAQMLNTSPREPQPRRPASSTALSPRLERFYAPHPAAARCAGPGRCSPAARPLRRSPSWCCATCRRSSSPRRTRAG